MNILQIAMGEIGVRGIPGVENNPQILKYAEETGISGYKSDETAWCSLFMNWVAKKAGMERSNNLLARSWLNFGIPVQSPEPGDIVIFWRENINSSKGHVGIFMGFSVDGTRIYSLGGNQGNQVSITAFSKDILLGFRRLRAKKKVDFAAKDLKKGDSGEEVVVLQDALKQMGYQPGTSDGVFGDKTVKALKDFQSTDSSMVINGVFDGNSRAFLRSLLNNN